jgi:hypothetical protein
MGVNPHQLAAELLDESKLWCHKDLPFEASLEKGHPRVLLVAGENGSGKSLLVEGLLGWGRHHHGISPVQVSIRQRVGGGAAEMGGFARMMMFGDETEQSTGATSVKVLEGAFSTIASRAEENKSALLVLDEPELGLSDGYAQAMGTYLAEKALQLPPRACGLVIVTHSRSLAQSLADDLGAAPSFLKLGVAQPYEKWLEGEPRRSVKDLLQLPVLGRERWKVINVIANKLKAK